MKKMVLTLSLVLLMGLSLMGAPAASAKTIVTCATGTTGGGFYLLGSAMATILQRYVPDITAANQSTGGAPENVRLVGTGKATLGLAGGDHMYFGYRGGLMFKQPYKDIRLLVGTYIPTEHMVVHADSDIKRVTDLKGKKISGTPGFQVKQLAPAILKAVGVNPAEVKLVPLGFGESISTFSDRNVDAFFLASGYPHPLVKQVTSARKCRFLTLDKATVDKMLKDYPYWVFSQIPAKTYQGQNNDMTAVTSPVAWITNVKVPADLIYQITKTIIEKNAEYKKMYRLGGAFNKKNALAAKGIIPLHPGAEKYYKEIGILK
jgi:TRAP transporter TAXI family solute receptor